MQKSKIKMTIQNRGFTLIELLIVIFIIGVLATFVTMVLGGARVKARDARRKSDLHELKSALELYRNDNATYPEAGATNNWEGAIFINEALNVLVDNDYIETIFKDPKDDGSHNEPYIYKYYGLPTSFTLFASLENGNDSDDKNGEDAGGYEVGNE